LTGSSFVFTGALEQDRKSAEAAVRALGAETPSSVTRTLTHLVVGGDRSAPSTKQKAAEKLIADGAAIAILDEPAFNALLAGLSSLPAPASSLPGPADEPARDTGETAPPGPADSTASSTEPVKPKPPGKGGQLTLF
jgi:BRCT domain type II-containing protein